jgi:hypothetical protein
MVDWASGSTDRIISYSGDIISESYSNSDFLSDIDAMNIQKRFEDSGSNFLQTQYDYNSLSMDGLINPKEEFITNNGGIDSIRENIENDIRSNFGAYFEDTDFNDVIIDFIFGTGLKQTIAKGDRVKNLKRQIKDFIDFLEN